MYSFPTNGFWTKCKHLNPVLPLHEIAQRSGTAYLINLKPFLHKIVVNWGTFRPNKC